MQIFLDFDSVRVNTCNVSNTVAEKHTVVQDRNTAPVRIYTDTQALLRIEKGRQMAQGGDEATMADLIDHAVRRAYGKAAKA